MLDTLFPLPAKVGLMARTNYSYEKRQRDLAKKKKKEEKRLKKQGGRATDDASPDQPNKEDAAITREQTPERT